MQATELIAVHGQSIRASCPATPPLNSLILDCKTNDNSDRPTGLLCLVTSHQGMPHQAIALLRNSAMAQGAGRADMYSATLITL